MSNYVSVDISLSNGIDTVISNNELNLKKCEALLSMAQRNIGASLVQERINLGERIIQNFRQANNKEQARDISSQILEYLGECRTIVKASLQDTPLVKTKEFALEEIEAQRLAISSYIKDVLSTWNNSRAYNLALVHIAEIKEQALEKSWSKEQISQALQELYSKLEQHIAAHDAHSLCHSSTTPQDHKDIDPYEDHELVEPDLTDEESRKHIVKAIFHSLNKAGFVVAKPIKKLLDDGSDIVLIQAARACGNKAEFEVKLNGKLTYKFDHYSGQSCQKDIDQVIPKLTEIYGIKLSNKKVFWSNPDDESATSRPLSPTTRSLNK